MNVVNATLLSITPRLGATPANDERFGTAIAVAVPCMVEAVSNSQRWNLGATIKDASQTLFLFKNDFASAAPAGVAPPAQGDMLSFAIDGADSLTGQVIAIVDNNFGALSHWELFLKTP